MALLLTESDVTTLLPMSLALEAVEQVFRWQGEGRLTNRPRVRLPVPGGLLHVMPAALPEARVMGLKAYATVRGGAKFVVLLFAAESGALLAVIEADRLGQMRTGAASGVATRYLAREDADRVGCYGTGWQARSQLEAVCAVRGVREVRVYGRDPARRARFAEEMSGALGLRVVAVDEPEAAARDAGILVTITNSRTPVLEGRWIAPGAHVNAAGSNALQRAELDVEAVRRAAVVVTDSLEQARVECGDLVAPIAQGVLRWEDVHELGEVVVGKHPGRTRADAITLFESQGVAMEDVAVAVRLVERARERRVGTEIPI
ncbi:MAG TPA: ornithine cyclodeaminase family protein [Methylomirabilota bacterium]|jgi:alanine dehydrogenase|nr:ornithine cyclodeaminase family protein [Methylomirabilota bacterium]